jgi:hypothetical protein
MASDNKPGFEPVENAIQYVPHQCLDARPQSATGCAYDSSMSPTWLRQFAVVMMTTAIFVLASCGGGQSEPTSTSLPLQAKGLAVGGDVQAGATKIARFSITKKQLEAIIKACNEDVVIPAAGADTCRSTMASAIAESVVEVPASDGEVPSQPASRGLFLQVLGATNSAGLPAVGYLEVVDSRHTGALCNADPGHVCLRVGIATDKALSSLLKSAPTPSSSSPATPTTATPTSGDTDTTPTPTPTPTLDSTTSTPTSEGPGATSTQGT